MPVRDLAFRIEAIPPRGAKVPASAFKEIAGGNALNAAIGIARLGGRAALTGAMGDAGETSARIIFEQLAQEGIDSRHLVHLPGLVTPISAVMIDESGERTTSLPRSGCGRCDCGRGHAARRLQRGADRGPLAPPSPRDLCAEARRGAFRWWWTDARCRCARPARRARPDLSSEALRQTADHDDDARRCARWPR